MLAFTIILFLDMTDNCSKLSIPGQHTYLGYSLGERYLNPRIFISVGQDFFNFNFNFVFNYYERIDIAVFWLLHYK